MSKKHFSAAHRLHTPADFDRVFKHNEYRASAHEFLLLGRNNRLHRSRLGLVVGKRITRLSVTRNNIKRLLREYFRTHLATFPGIDVVIVTRPGIGGKSNAEIRSSVNKLWHKMERQIKDKRL